MLFVKIVIEQVEWDGLDILEYNLGKQVGPLKCGTTCGKHLDCKAFHYNHEKGLCSIVFVSNNIMSVVMHSIHL